MLAFPDLFLLIYHLLKLELLMPCSHVVVGLIVSWVLIWRLVLDLLVLDGSILLHQQPQALFIPLLELALVEVGMGLIPGFLILVCLIESVVEVA